MERTSLPGTAAAPARAAVCLLAAVVVLAACTGQEPTASPSPTTTTAVATPAVPQVPVRDATLGAEPPAAAPAPVRIAVPDVGIDMAVDPVGVLEDGEMEIPEDANRAGWYRFGPAPADPAGATVIAGHVDSVQTGIGQFAKLLDVPVGAVVTVTTADGSARQYRVVGVEKVAKDGAPVAQWFDRSGPPRLILVTCGGAFRRDIGHYTDNVVVTAEPIGG